MLRKDQIDRKLLFLQAFDDLRLKYARPRAKLSELNADLDALRKLFVDSYTRSREANLQTAVGVARTTHEKRESEQFLLDVRGIGGEIIVGWTALVKRLCRPENTIRNYFSRGSGVFSIVADEQVIEVTRLKDAEVKTAQPRPVPPSQAPEEKPKHGFRTPYPRGITRE